MKMMRILSPFRNEPFLFRKKELFLRFQLKPWNTKQIWKRNFSELQGCDTTDDTLTMTQVKECIMARLGLETGYTLLPKCREHLLKFVPKLADLPPRSIHDSLTTAIIPLSVDKVLQDRYIAFLGQARFGRLMEDMDMFAVWVCHKHLHIPNLPEDCPLPYTFVTILVDKIEISSTRSKGNEDIRLTGHVSWVGTSSMEIMVWLEQKYDSKWEEITKAVFLMAARNATNTAAAPVNPLKPTNDAEKIMINDGEKRKSLRQLEQASNIFKVEPNDYEQSLMYSIFKKTSTVTTMELNRRILPTNCRWMSESYVINTMACYPENRNAHNTVFGGFLMRIALEMSFVAASLYCKNRAQLKIISDVSFQNPVSVNSFLKMSAYVIYTELNYITIMTVADVLDAITSDQVTSNIFYYTFVAPEEVPTVLPRSYHESMWYIHGRRKFRHSLGFK